jgi:hypothetical protein
MVAAQVSDVASPGAYRGSCHCGAVSFLLKSSKSPEEFAVRSCQCGFCRSQSASWTSDPEGELEVRISGPVHRYRFGTKSADFLVCTTCGLTPAVVSVSGGKLLGVVRANLFESAEAFLSGARPIEFDEESPQTRLARRSRSWTPATLIES